jgi:hypothetical protein
MQKFRERWSGTPKRGSERALEWANACQLRNSSDHHHVGVPDVVARIEVEQQKPVDSKVDTKESGHSKSLKYGAPYRIRTGVLALRGLCPGPLDEGSVCREMQSGGGSRRPGCGARHYRHRSTTLKSLVQLG